MKWTTARLSRRQVLQASAMSLAALGLSGISGLAHARSGNTTARGNAMTQNTAAAKPTIVLVHGAFAESASWNDVVSTLLGAGYPAVALANPLRGVKYDSDYLASFLKSVEGPVVLVGHSYGGSVITAAVSDASKVKALVYVDAYAPEQGETPSNLTGRFPGSTLMPTLAPPVPLGDGTGDLYIKQADYHAQFCADVPAALAAQMAVTQRPIVDRAFDEAQGERPAWKVIPSWFIYGELDKNIPPAAHRFMAERAGARETVEVKGASHVAGVSHPDEVAAMILRAAQTVETSALTAQTVG